MLWFVPYQHNGSAPRVRHRRQVTALVAGRRSACRAYDAASASDDRSDRSPTKAKSEKLSGNLIGAAIGHHRGLKGRLDAAHGPYPRWTRGLLPDCCPGSRLPLPMAAPSAPRCAGAPGRSGSLRCAAARTGFDRPVGLGLDAPPASRVPPRLRRGGGGGFAPRSCTGAGAPQIAGAICAWRLPPAPRQPGWGQVRLGGLRSACCTARRVAAAPVHGRQSGRHPQMRTDAH